MDTIPAHRLARAVEEIADRFPRFEIRTEELRPADRRGLCEAVEVYTIIEAGEDCDDMFCRIARGEEDEADALGWWLEWGNRHAEAQHAIAAALVNGTLSRRQVDAVAQAYDGDYEAAVLRLEDLVAEIA